MPGILAYGRPEPLPPGVTGALCRPEVAGWAALGECLLTTDTEGSWLVTRADPAIAVSGELLMIWHDKTPEPLSLECRDAAAHLGDVIRIAAANQRVVYVVTRRVDAECDVREARWPD